MQKNNPKKKNNKNKILHPLHQIKANPIHLPKLRMGKQLSSKWDCVHHHKMKTVWK